MEAGSTVQMHLSLAGRACAVPTWPCPGFAAHPKAAALVCRRRQGKQFSVSVACVVSCCSEIQAPVYFAGQAV